MTDFDYVSCFSGVGGFEQGLNRLGGKCVLASEIDKHARKSYEALYGHEPEGDIKEINAEDVPDHDLLVSGFPCQSFSVAGHRGGFEDARGTLFFDVARIADEKQPKVILAENVKGLVGHDKGKTLDTIVKTLNDIGYRVDFNVLNSKFFGVPQNRERIFIVAIREDLVENEAWTDIKGAKAVPKGKRRISKYEDVKTFNFDWPAQGEVTTRLRDVLETNVDEGFYLSEEKTQKLVAQLESNNGRKSEEGGVTCVNPRDIDGTQTPQRERAYEKEGLMTTLQPGLTGRFNVVEDKDVKPEKIAGLYGMNKQAGSMWDVDKIAPTVKTPSGGNSEPIIEEPGLPIQEATNKGYALAEEGDSVNFRFPGSKTRRGRVGKQVANTLEATGINQGVVRPVLTPERMEKRQNGRRFKENEEESFTLTEQDRHGVALGEFPRYRIRKLTPRECFRLQGFSDKSFDALVEAGVSNSQLYKQSGNAVTVNVIEALGERLVSYF